METIKELIPPYYSNTDESYINSLTNKLNIYNDYLFKLVSTKIINEGVRLSIIKISSEILRSIEVYLHGNSGESFMIIDMILQNNLVALTNTSFKLTKEHCLIRLRESNSSTLQKSDLFHIPFNKRQLVSKKRYSIEGLPCLYLSATSYTAWLELNKPSFNSVWASAFRTQNEIEIFDLSFTLKQVIDDFHAGILKVNDLISRLILFPFVLATSFRTKNPKDFFNEEYIISGNLLQWIIKNTEFKGIRYLSTKLNSYSNSKNLWCYSNFVIPPKMPDKSNDYNDFLTKTFRMTEPHNCAILISYSNAGGVSCFALGGQGIKETTEESHNERFETPNSIDEIIFDNYDNTSFYNIDGYLNSNFKFDFLNSDR